MLRLVALVSAGGCYRKDLAPDPAAVPFARSPAPHTYVTEEDLPPSFDWKASGWLTPMLNQHIPKYCGSCWLHASISALSDRIHIVSNATQPMVQLARQVVLNCGAAAGTCGGGSDTGVYEYMRTDGLPDETCQQYEAVDKQCSDEAKCMNCDPPGYKHPTDPFICYPVQRYTKYFVKEWGTLANASVTQIKAELFRRGPITCSIDSSPLEDGHYVRGKIIDTQVDPAGKPFTDTDHIVGIVGWGVDHGTEYWLVRNSWGRFWGDDGFFRVATGTNVMLIESSCNWAVPDWPPVTKDFGPSDQGHCFPSGDTPTQVVV